MISLPQFKIFILNNEDPIQGVGMVGWIIGVEIMGVDIGCVPDVCIVALLGFSTHINI